jgi:hypothetical protein
VLKGKGKGKPRERSFGRGIAGAGDTAEWRQNTYGKSISSRSMYCGNRFECCAIQFQLSLVVAGGESYKLVSKA